MIRPPPRSTLFPCTTHFRSGQAHAPRDQPARALAVDPRTARLAVDEARRLVPAPRPAGAYQDRKSTRLNSSHANISYAVFCLKKINLKTHNNSSHSLRPLLV